MTTKPNFKTIEVDRIDPDPNQPRKEFAEAELQELADSLTANGQLQAIAVRYDRTSRRYTLVVGERRWRAAQLAGLETLNAQVFDVDDDAAFELQIAENVNRLDMTPMEEATAYNVLRGRGWDVARIAGAYGKSEPYIQWRIDLLNLSTDLKELVEKGHLPIGAAWYVCLLPQDTQQRFLVKWARGDFKEIRDAEEFARACRHVEAQGGFFSLDESQHTEEKREEVAAARKKVTSKIDRLAAAGEILLEIANTDPAELAEALAGADGGIKAYQQRVKDLQAVAGKAVVTLRKAAAIAAAVTIEIDPAVVTTVDGADGGTGEDPQAPVAPQPAVDSADQDHADSDGESGPPAEDGRELATV
jgi:ParB family transcriptional regulator, chromosome partitioning protein